MTIKEFKTVGYDQMMKSVFGGESVQVHGMYKYEPDNGDFVENTLIPSVYERFRKKQEQSNYITQDKSKLYYPHGKDNRFPFFLLDLQSQSTTLESAIDQTAKSARGRGLTVLCEDPVVKAEMKKWLKDVGINNEFQRKFFLNLATTKGAFVELKFGGKADSTNGVRKGLISANVPNFIHYRVGKVNKLGETKFYWYHPNFYARRVDTKRLRGIRKYESVEKSIEKALENTVFQHDKETPFYDDPDQKAFNLGTFVYQVRDYTLKSEHYPLPTYSNESTINAILSEAAMSQMDMASIENGLSTGYFATVPLIKPREDDEEGMKRYEKEKQEYLNYIQDNLQGAENTDNVVVLFADPRRNHKVIEIAEVPHNNTSDVLEGKDSRAKTKILTAFRITNAALIGIPPESGKGLNNQSGLLAEADDQFYTDFVSDHTHLAEEFFEDVIIPIFKQTHGIADEVEIIIQFPRKRRFNTMPSDKILLAVVPTSKIWDLYNLGEFDEEARLELKRDLEDRQIAKTPSNQLADNQDTPDDNIDNNE